MYVFKNIFCWIGFVDVYFPVSLDSRTIAQLIFTFTFNYFPLLWQCLKNAHSIIIYWILHRNRDVAGGKLQNH